MDGLCPATIRSIEHPIKSAILLNTRNPCPAQDPYINSNVREISLVAVANGKRSQYTVLKKISTMWLLMPVLGREKER